MIVLERRFKSEDKMFSGPLCWVSSRLGLRMYRTGRALFLFRASLGQVDRRVTLLTLKSISPEPWKESAGAFLGQSWPSTVLKGKDQFL